MNNAITQKPPCNRFLLAFPVNLFDCDRAIIAFGMLTGREPDFIQPPTRPLTSWMLGYANREETKDYMRWMSDQPLAPIAAR